VWSFLLKKNRKRGSLKPSPKPSPIYRGKEGGYFFVPTTLTLEIFLKLHRVALEDSFFDSYKRCSSLRLFQSASGKESALCSGKKEVLGIKF
jgi:hypothetical protein